MKKIAIVLAVLAAPVATATAQRGGDHGWAAMTALDLNHDGAITKVEARAGREAAFRTADTDNDGFITAAEKQAQRADNARKRAGRGDSNRDGKISRSEFLARPYRAFDRFDANHNDVLEASELEAARTMMLQRKQGTP